MCRYRILQIQEYSCNLDLQIDSINQPEEPQQRLLENSAHDQIEATQRLFFQFSLNTISALCISLKDYAQH